MIPGHSLSKQECTCVSSPVQLSPPFFGSGVVQVRLFVLSPTPQEAEQDVQLLQALHPPSTEIE